MISGDLPSNSKKATFSASTPVPCEYCVNLVCSSVLTSGLRAANREARDSAGDWASDPRSTVRGCRALTVQVVDDLHAGGLGLHGVDESEVVEHGLDHRHVVVVLPRWRSAAWQINRWLEINVGSAHLRGYSLSLWYTKRPGVSVFLARCDADQHPDGLKGERSSFLRVSGTRLRLHSPPLLLTSRTRGRG